MFDAVLWLCGHGETKDFTVSCLANALQKSKYKYDISYLSGDALIGRSRSVACSRFLTENKAPYMIFIDTDILFTTEELDNLTESMMHGYDVIAGAYSVASGDRLAIRGWDPNIVIDGRIIEVEYVSTGFFGMSRKALETIRDKCPFSWFDYTKGTMTTQMGLPFLHKGDWCECYPFFEAGALAMGQNEQFYISEDWDFCNKARRVGIKTYFHTGILVDHCKSTIIHAEDMLQSHAAHKESQTQPAIGLITELSEFMGKPFTETRDAVTNYTVKANKTDDEWLIELAQFNSFAYYRSQRMRAIEGLGGQNILDYGCGIGTAAIIMSGGNKVCGYDQNKRLIDFCNYRVKKNNYLNIGFTNEEPELDQFDIVMFIDVLEHFEDLETFIKHLGEKMKSGAKIYHFDAFFDHATPGHFDHSAKINDYLKAAGFAVFDALWAVKI